MIATAVALTPHMALGGITRNSGWPWPHDSTSQTLQKWGDYRWATNNGGTMLTLSRTFLTVLFLGVVMATAGCASSHILVGKARPPISPEQVKVYLRPPAKYEEIALLEASSKNSLAVTQQGKTNKAIERLREEAAQLGANGILLQGSGTEYGGSVNTGAATATGNTAYGTGVSFAVMHKAASGMAIFVYAE